MLTKHIRLLQTFWALFFVTIWQLYLMPSPTFAQSNKDKTNRDKNWVSGGFFDQKQISGDISAHQAPKTTVDTSKYATPSSDVSANTENVGVGSSVQPVKEIDSRKEKRQNENARHEIEGIGWAKERLERDLDLAKEQDRRAAKGRTEPTNSDRSSTRDDNRGYITRESQSGFFNSPSSADPLNLGRSTVSLLVSAEPDRDYERTVQELVDLRNKKNARIGEVVVVGAEASDNKRAMQIKKWAEDSLKNSDSDNRDSPNSKPDFALNSPDFVKDSPLKKFKFTHFQDVNMDVLLVKYGIQNSPAWIINYEGINYILEGPNSIWSFFSQSGEFTPAANASRSAAISDKSTQPAKKNPEDLVGQSYLVTNTDPVIPLPSSSAKNLFRIRSSSERVYRYGPDL